MTIWVPNYYKDFKCIADRCRHNCCIGWEIDIDEETLAQYRSYNGPLGVRMKNSISLEGDPHFILDDKERCPFLAKDGLCDIIREKGEGALCQICADHPRFRNEFDDFEEQGLGLCCEEAARLILSESRKVEWVPLSKETEKQTKEWEDDFFKKRHEIINLLQERALPYSQRVAKIADRFSIVKKTIPQWRSILMETEKMEPDLDEYLRNLDHSFLIDEAEWALPLEQLSVYFINRHLYHALDDELFESRLSMAIGFAKIICAIAQKRANGFSLNALIDTARLFSAEIEYSDQNIDWILSKL